jgi:hypothetical protein
MATPNLAEDAILIDSDDQDAETACSRFDDTVEMVKYPANSAHCIRIYESDYARLEPN